MSKRFGTNVFKMDSGERFCHVIDIGSGLPEYHPNLFLTTQHRNRSNAYSTIEASASNIVVFLRFLERRQINLEKRILTRTFFKENELDALCDFTQRRFTILSASSPDNHPIFSLDELEESQNPVTNETQYARLTTIADYFGWLSRNILTDPSRTDFDQVNAIIIAIKARRPRKKQRNTNFKKKSFDDNELDVLFEVIRPGSKHNPFAVDVQKRNRLVVLLLFHLGVRGGELLNIRISDIDFSSNKIRIVRRPDETSDIRNKEPNVKTLERTLPAQDSLIKEIHDYVIGNRRLVRNARKNDFLFITHKRGKTVGNPLSKAAYYKIMSLVMNVAPTLYRVTGHMFRHTWNRRFSEAIDAMDEPFDESREEQIRSYLMGWKESSGTAARYNKRHIERKSQEAALSMQEDMKTYIPSRIRDHEKN